MLSPPQVTNGRSLPVLASLARIEPLDHDTVGCGYASTMNHYGAPHEAVKGALDRLCKRLIGRDAREITSILDDLDRVMLGNNQAKSGIDCALHDLQARRLGVPICDLFGGPAVREFATLRILPIKSPADMANNRQGEADRTTKAATRPARGPERHVGAERGWSAMAGSGDQLSRFRGTRARTAESRSSSPRRGAEASAIPGAPSSSTRVSRRLGSAGRDPQWRAVSSATRISCSSPALHWARSRPCGVAHLRRGPVMSSSIWARTTTAFLRSVAIRATGSAASTSRAIASSATGGPRAWPSPTTGKIVVKHSPELLADGSEL